MKTKFSREDEVALTREIADTLDKYAEVEGLPFVLLFSAPNGRGFHIQSNQPPEVILGVMRSACDQVLANPPTRAVSVSQEGETTEIDPRLIDWGNRTKQ